MPSGVRPFAALRATAWSSVILSGAKNLSGGVDRMAIACPERSEGMRRQSLETGQPRRWPLFLLRPGAKLGDQEGRVDGVQIVHEVGQKGIVASECQALYPKALVVA